jgi:3'-phosphoadenosine 5'-phosphosulfate sulfotransferase (PAPS reductase)/FAD synthetase
VEEIRNPDELVAAAKKRWQPIRSVCLFSGGGDSGVLAYRCREDYDELLFIDTGVCLPGVEEHVVRFAEMLGKPLTTLRSGDAYRTMVLGDDLWWERFAVARKHAPSLSIDGMIAFDKHHAKLARKRRLVKVYGAAPHGFPGKGQHGIAYTTLKQRRIEQRLRELKVGQPRTSNVLFLSGVRKDESDRRARNTKPMTETYSMKFVSPLLDWSNKAMQIAAADYGIPRSDVAALLHRSGECNCGAFADAEEELKMIRAFWPDWHAETIAPLEEEAQRRGIRWCFWGGYDVNGIQAAGSEDPGLLCQSCPTRRL